MLPSGEVPHTGEEVVLDGAVAGSGTDQAPSQVVFVDGWMVRATSGGSPNQNGEVGSTWVAWASRAWRRTSA